MKELKPKYRYRVVRAFRNDKYMRPGIWGMEYVNGNVLQLQKRWWFVWYDITGWCLEKDREKFDARIAEMNSSEFRDGSGYKILREYSNKRNENDSKTLWG